MKSGIFILFLLFANLSVSQNLLENDHLFLLGSHYVGDTSYQMGLYITVKENDCLELKVDEAKNWKGIGESVYNLSLVQKSSRKNRCKIKHNNKKYPAYKYVNNEGVELLILKDGNRLAKLKIPPNLIFGIKTPEIFHQK